MWSQSLLVLLVCISVALSQLSVQDVSDKIIGGRYQPDMIDNSAKTWKRGQNFPPNTPVERIIGLLGSKGVRDGPFEDRGNLVDNADIPEEFDAREKWQKCPLIGHVYDQGSCGSCWAVSTTEALADRLCIATNGKFSRTLSAEELTFCCHLCGNGCQGGYPKRAWSYFTYHGVVTGGEYNSNEGCQPYRFEPCGVENNTCGQQTEQKHRCSKECYGDKTINYKTDHRYAKYAYDLNYENIQTDIMQYGPLVASFDAYHDFIYNYTSGVYVKSENTTFMGGHAVKCIGWGVEDDVPYWLMVNSWGPSWGDGGFFKIRRGTNECRVDNSFTAGMV